MTMIAGESPMWWSNPFRALREKLYGRKDLGAGRVDEAMRRLRSEASALRSTIMEIADDDDPVGTMVHNMNQSKMHQVIAEESNGK